MSNTQKPSAAVRFFSVLSLILCIVMGLEVGTGMILAFSGEVPASDAVPMVLVFAVLTVVFGLIHRKLRQRVKLWKEQQKADAKLPSRKSRQKRKPSLTQRWKICFPRSGKECATVSQIRSRST